MRLDRVFKYNTKGKAISAKKNTRWMVGNEDLSVPLVLEELLIHLVYFANGEYAEKLIILEFSH